MRFTTIFLGLFASVALAAPTPAAEAEASPVAEAKPQFSVSGPLGSLSFGGLRNGGGFSAEGPLGSYTLGGLRDRKYSGSI
jgi:hypothetical protein